MIDSSEISVVIQGPIYDEITDKTVKNVREKLPNSQIIVSTWENSNYTNDGADIIVESKDPGGHAYCDTPKILYNVNRQIVSTFAGLQKANRLYALKIRSDMYFENTNFLTYFGKYKKRSNEYKFLKELVINTTNFAPNPYREPKLFHPSDWFYFGLTEDLLNIFDIPLCPEPETSRWFETRKRPTPKQDSFGECFCRYFVEQYLWVAFIKKNVELDFDNCFDIKKNNIEISEKIFANNLVLAEPYNLGINSYKHVDYFKKLHLSFVYTEREWIKLYKKYCNKNVKLPIIDSEKIRRTKLSYLRYKENKNPWTKNYFILDLKSLFNISLGNLILANND